MENLEKLLDKIGTNGKYYVSSVAGIQAKINRVNYQMDVLFWSFAMIMSIAAGYSVYRYIQSLKRGY